MSLIIHDLSSGHEAAAAPPALALHPAEGGASAVAEKLPLLPSLATLLAGHILRDGEVVLLILKPSRWFILFNLARFSAFIGIVLIAAVVWGEPRFVYSYVETALLLLAGRLMWAVLQWVGRLYVLTDCRILRLSGVFTIDVFDCPLRKIATTRVTQTLRERIWRLGSIEILPQNENMPAALWQTVRRPAKVHDQIQAAIRRAKSGPGAGSGGAADSGSRLAG